MQSLFLFVVNSVQVAPDMTAETQAHFDLYTKCPLLLSDLSQIGNASEHFTNILHIQSRNPSCCSQVVTRWQTDGQVSLKNLIGVLALRTHKNIDKGKIINKISWNPHISWGWKCYPLKIYFHCYQTNKNTCGAYSINYNFKKSVKKGDLISFHLRKTCHNKFTYFVPFGREMCVMYSCKTYFVGIVWTCNQFIMLAVQFLYILSAYLGNIFS